MKPAKSEKFLVFWGTRQYGTRAKNIRQDHKKLSLILIIAIDIYVSIGYIPVYSVVFGRKYR